MEFIQWGYQKYYGKKRIKKLSLKVVTYCDQFILFSEIEYQ